MQIVLQARRWLPNRRLVLIGDSSFAVIQLLFRLSQLKNPVCAIMRFRMDAALYEPVQTAKRPIGRLRKKGKRLPTLEKVAEANSTRWKKLTVQEWYGEKQRKIEITTGTAVWYHSGEPPLPIRWVIVRDPRKRFKTQALLCTDLNLSAEQIVKWFPRRWQVEVTFHEVRTHLGVETQRQWAKLSILRMTPALLSVFSLVTLLANVHAQKDHLPIQRTAWYPKKLPTFSDALFIVKQTLAAEFLFRTSPVHYEVQKPLTKPSRYRSQTANWAFL